MTLSHQWKQCKGLGCLGQFGPLLGASLNPSWFPKSASPTQTSTPLQIKCIAAQVTFLDQRDH